ncbi:MAG: ABC transporter permease [Candidatus Korarchaeota archaeon]|nr:ABC transporter permease [Candidatus Korarchaeota archaeon]NIU85359.1 ABC transporter permease subunit [Candidatus Thorarchaeota archaeon]NIW15457.1 ABC transporter permease subunit [Candidatus Thorarchaeota archaeon]NIW53401.1 ABC transporter permease subunit [Candidatus Korarchaeota archaeon]
MRKINLRSIYAVSKKEFKDNIRNYWIVALISIFFLLTLLTSFFVGGQGENSAVFGGFEETVATLLSIGSALVPIIAIMLGYATISGEVESGSLDLVLSYPLRRVELLLGKMIGLSGVVGLSTVVGFGLGGVLIAFFAGAASWTGYLTFIMLTILLGVLYLSVSTFFSTLTSKRSTSLGIAIVIFFWGMIYGTLILGIFLAQGHSMADLLQGEAFPEWLWRTLVLSPQDMYQAGAMLAFDVEEAFGLPLDLPGFINLRFLVSVQLLWTIIPLILSFYVFKKKDL